MSERRRRRSWCRSTGGIVTAALLAGGCAGGDGGSPSVATTTMVTTTTVTTSKVTVTSSITSSVTSSITSSVAASSTTPTSTAAPTSAGEPAPAELAALRDEVMSDLHEAYEAFDAVKQDPTDAAVVARLASVMTTERARYVIDTFVTPYVTNDLAERTNPDLPARIDFLTESFEVDRAAGTASIDYCYLSSNLLVEIGGGPGGGDVVQDDRFAAVLVHNELVFDGERWLDAGGEDVSVRVGETECE